MKPIKEYDVSLDAKHRCVVRGATATKYHAQVFSDGKIVMEPMLLVPLKVLSKLSKKNLKLVTGK